MPDRRELFVIYESLLVGTLTEANNIWSFQYEQEWIETGFPISPHLPLQSEAQTDGASFRPIQQFFDNLLPEEAARKLMAQDAGINLSDHFALLAYYGAESAGALTLSSTKGSAKDEPSLREISKEKLSERIHNLPQLPLSHGSPKRMSLAGAQHKLPIVYETDRFFEPEGSAVSRHILKPDHHDVDSFPHSVANEWFCMTLAKKVNLPVPEVMAFHVPESVYVVERFDRVVNEDPFSEPLRLHMLDGCQLLGYSSHSKYDQCTLENLLEIINACQKKLVTRIALFEWLLFNYLIGNGDAHLKNLSVFCGTQGHNLTPHYDLLSTTVYCRDLGRWMDELMVTPIGEARAFADVTRDHWLEAANILKTPPKKAEEILEKLPALVWKEAKALESRVLKEKVLKPGEQRMVSAIVQGPIKEACMKLKVDVNA